MNTGDPEPIRPQVDRFRDPGELAAHLGDWMAGPGALYRKLAAALERAVQDGTLEPLERLPSERALAKALVVSRATVVAAYDDLRGRGVVDSRRGSGTRVLRRSGPPKPGADGRVPGGTATPIFQRLIDGPREMISLARAMDGAVPELAEELAALLADDLPGLMTDTGYHPRGLPALRAAVAAHFTGGGLRTTPDQVVITTGVSQALALVAQMYLRRRSIVIVESPGWPGCFDVFRAAGAELLGVPLDEDGIRSDALARALADHRPDLMYLMPTVHNPTGALMSEGRRRRVAELAAEHGVPILEDNAFNTGGHQTPPIAAFAPDGADVLSADSLAKTVWGGLRTGWIRGRADAVERLARHKALADLGSPVLDQALAARLLPRLPEISAARRAVLDQRLDHLTALLAAHLPEWRFTRPAHGTTALWIELPGTNAQDFAQVALRHGVEVVPGGTMDSTGAHDSFIRLPCTFPLDVLNDLTIRLGGAWHDLRAKA